MKNILVTGGAGYIGSHTVVELVAAKFRPVIVDNFSNSEKSVLDKLHELTGQEISCYDHDYQDNAFLKDIVTKENIDGVIHFAALKAVGESVEQPLKYYRNNVVGLIGLLEVLEATGVASFIFSSSCTVYGEADQLPLTEDSPIKPAASPYGATKQMDEIIIRDTVAASQKLKGLALRYFNPVGAHPSAKIGELQLGNPTILVPMLTQAVAGLRDELTVYGNNYDTPDGTCVRDYIHVVDLAKAHVGALEYINSQPAAFFDVCNVGTGRGTSVLEVIKSFEASTGQKVPYKIGPRRPGDIVASYAAVDKANKILNWKAEKSLEEALVDAWRWQQTLLKK